MAAEQQSWLSTKYLQLRVDNSLRIHSQMVLKTPEMLLIMHVRPSGSGCIDRKLHKNL